MDFISKYILLKKAYSYPVLRKMISLYRTGVSQEHFYQEFLTSEDFKNFYQEQEEEGLKYLKEHKVFCISIFEEEYPPLLKNIFDPPPFFLYQGKLELLQKTKFSVVGSRMAPKVYLDLALQLGLKLSENGYTVVSGLARGVDTKAHLGALEGEGGTIGVLGCGLDVCYPKENLNLQNQLGVSGGLLSEYPLGTQPLKYHFPRRNRIVAALGESLIVVYGREKSGAFITLDFALDAGRDIFVSKQVAKILKEDFYPLRDLKNVFLGL